MKDKEFTKEEDKICRLMAWICCHADEDCPSEYRTKHFRTSLNEAIDYLEKELNITADLTKYEKKRTLTEILSQVISEKFFYIGKCG